MLIRLFQQTTTCSSDWATHPLFFGRLRQLRLTVRSREEPCQGCLAPLGAYEGPCLPSICAATPIVY
jgi:hypothetical protein